MDVFLRFAELCPVGIDARTVEPRRPPQPDILCRAGGFACAFELVELIDPDAVRRHRRQVDMQSRLIDACDALAPETSVELRRRVGNASISIAFVEDASVRARERAIPRMIELLLGLDPRFSGEIAAQPWWARVIRAMRVTRVQLVGPVFSVTSAGYQPNPMVARIQAKLEKKYESDAPLELLAFHHFRRPPLPKSMWYEPVQALLGDKLNASPFRRVWVFDHNDRRIDLVLPPFASNALVSFCPPTMT